MANTILLVDDDDMLRETLKTLLELEGFHVFEAGNGLEALEILKTEKIHVVLSDMLMPLLNGYELLEKIQDFQSPRPAVIMMSGYSKYSAPDCIKNGALRFLQKPVSCDQLIETIKAVGKGA